jgi:hypothetical protein
MRIARGFGDTIARLLHNVRPMFRRLLRPGMNTIGEDGVHALDVETIICPNALTSGLLA